MGREYRDPRFGRVPPSDLCSSCLPGQSSSLGARVVATASIWASDTSSMVKIDTWMPLVRNLTDPGHRVDSWPIPAEGQSVSVGAVISVVAGAIWTNRRPEPHLHPVNGPAGSVGSDSGALPIAARSLRRSEEHTRLYRRCRMQQC